MLIKPLFPLFLVVFPGGLLPTILLKLLTYGSKMHKSSMAPEVNPTGGRAHVNGDQILPIDTDTTKTYQAIEVIDAQGKVITPGY